MNKVVFSETDAVYFYEEQSLMYTLNPNTCSLMTVDVIEMTPQSVRNIHTHIQKVTIFHETDGAIFTPLHNIRTNIMHF